MSIELTPYTQQKENDWNSFCDSSLNSTMLHYRNFLNYHKGKFEDESLMVSDSKGLVGLLPAAKNPFDSELVVSHPGATYGGIVHTGRLSGNLMLDAMEMICRHYKDKGFKRFQYKPVPSIYKKNISEDDLYALFRIGARLIRCDLSSGIEIAARRDSSDRRKRGLKKSQKYVTLSKDNLLFSSLWKIIVENLHREHGAKPVHSLDELLQLQLSFPKNIFGRYGIIDGKIEAGVIFFNSSRVWHAQYIASSEIGYQFNALDSIVEASIEEAKLSGVDYFDFGTSNESNGAILNDGLYRFKNEFGGTGIAHQYFEINL
jgi:hypothetical protein